MNNIATSAQPMTIVALEARLLHERRYGEGVLKILQTRIDLLNCDAGLPSVQLFR